MPIFECFRVLSHIIQTSDIQWVIFSHAYLVKYRNISEPRDRNTSPFTNRCWLKSTDQ